WLHSVRRRGVRLEGTTTPRLVKLPAAALPWAGATRICTFCGRKRVGVTARTVASPHTGTHGGMPGPGTAKGRGARVSAPWTGAQVCPTLAHGLSGSTLATITMSPVSLLAAPTPIPDPEELDSGTSRIADSGNRSVHEVGVREYISICPYAPVFV